MISKEQYIGQYDYDRLAALCAVAKEREHKFWIGDIPVVGSLLKFYNELRYKRTDIVVHTDHRPARYNGEDYLVFADLSVAYKDSPTVRVGRIGLEQDKDGVTLYVVESKRIQNDKFNSYSDGYHVKMTKKFPNAVKNAVQYLKPKVLTEVQDDSQAVLNRAIENMKEPAQNKLYEASRMQRDTILEELHYMVQAGYEPITPQFKNSIAILREQGEELRAMDKYKPRKCFVWAKTDRVEYKYDDESEPHVVFNLQDVPENVRDKIAVLQIGDSRTALMDVGYKVSNDMYWVFV